MIRVTGTAVIVAASVAVGPAHADPAATIDLAGCRIFDPDEARRAIAAELTIPASARDKLDAVRVVVACPDATTTLIAVTPAPPDGPLEKRLDLGELPEDLRLRLVALAVAELVAIAVDVVPDRAGAPPAPPSPAPRARPIGEGGLDARPFGRDRGPVLATEAPTVTAPDAAPARIRAYARAGVRAFLDRPAAMPELAIGGARGRFGADLFVASVSRDDRLGTLRGTVAGLGLSATLDCRGGGGVWLCLGARAAAGAVGVTTQPVHPMITSDDAIDFYAEAGLRLEARLEYHRWWSEIGFGGGWSAGSAAFAEDREVLRMSGPVVTGSVALGWAR